ncbi:MAG: extracellular solute-binding protein [Sulfolobaceae archaeon]|nr:extracellular solute-binding protein [Sulfolobaceae archaeon]
MSVKRERALSKTIVAVIAVIIIVIVAVGGYYAYISTTHHPSMVTSTTYTTTSTTTTTTSILNTSNPQALMQLVGLTSPPSTNVTITVWNSYSTSENQAFNETLAQFEKEFPWIHVEVTYGVGVGTSQFETAAKAGKAPIVYRDTSDSGGALFAAGLVLNLSQYLPPSIVNLYLPTAIQDWELNGSLYGLPDNINYIVMFYNKHYVPYPPNTTAQLIQIAEQVNKTYGIWGIAYGASDEYGYRFAAWFAGFGGSIFTTTSSGQIIPALNSTAMAEALNFWYNLTYNLHINYLAPSTGAGGAEGQLFIANKTAIIFDGPWDLNAYLQALGPNLGAAPLPVVSQTGLRAAPFIGSTGWLIATPQASGATQMQIKAALIFILYVTNYQSDLRLFQVAHDIPANVQAYNEAIAELNAGELQPSYLNQIMEGILEQAKYGQKFPNIPQMAYYWNSFHQYASEFFANKINATQAAQGMEQAFIQSLVQNGLLSEILPLPAMYALYLAFILAASVLVVSTYPLIIKLPKW